MSLYNSVVIDINPQMLSIDCPFSEFAHVAVLHIERLMGC